ncbi:T9SS type A sorting domain-containing protein [Luteirhabdus pelagi]|uniref:T9SS type A sorting domain-containing protein n=1 Tax=Luteirhabdus pelagi TaxID=2792783 RepID=UPI001939A6C9|nr:T9SS type A sorting domain-containing protein [Luteirhabdus pelagi]
MKLLVTVLLSFTSVIGSAQELPEELYDTWYLYSFQASDKDPYYEISDIEPEISPYIVIDENLSIQGEGVCNSFEGDYELLGTVDFKFLEGSFTDADCQVQIHTSFENSYFPFIMGEFWYTLEEVDQGHVLRFHTPLFGLAVYRNYELTNETYSKQKISIYPNPVSNSFQLQSGDMPIEKIIIFNALGQRVLSQEKPKSVDVSKLPSGYYLVEIISDGISSIQKIIIQ